MYERILRIPGIGRYLSVAWLRSEDYWRDAPGQHSMQLNYDLIQLGLRIERTLILNDFFWPPGALLPVKPIYGWIEEQYKQGIVVHVVRESEIAEERDLLCDFGIYCAGLPSFGSFRAGPSSRNGCRLWYASRSHLRPGSDSGNKILG